MEARQHYAEQPRIEVTRGSGNVFAVLGFANSDEMLAKAQLVDAIVKTIDKRGFKQKEAAELIGLTQPKISAVLKGNTIGFSCDRLMRVLTKLGQDVNITVKPGASKTSWQSTLALAA